MRLTQETIDLYDLEPSRVRNDWHLHLITTSHERMYELLFGLSAREISAIANTTRIRDAMCEQDMLDIAKIEAIETEFLAEDNLPPDRAIDFAFRLSGCAPRPFIPASVLPPF